MGPVGLISKAAAVHPVVGAAESGPLRADDADMARRKGLAEGTGVEDLRRLIRHPLDAGIPLLVNIPCLSEHLVDLLFFRVDFDLDFIEDGAEILVKLGIEDLAQMGRA